MGLRVRVANKTFRPSAPRPYSAGVLVDLDHEYAISGSLSQFFSIAASGASHVVAASTGRGTALMNSSSPGNGLILEFTISDPTPFHLTGAISHPNPMAFSLVALQEWDGIVWQNGIFTSYIHLPGGTGSFDVSGRLSPGLYRMNSALALNAFGNEDYSASYGYQLSVPEPASSGLLWLGALLVRRRGR
jgi:hypothetical protein